MTAVGFSYPSAGGISPAMELAKAPWIRPGVVVHEATAPVDDLLAAFAQAIAERGFNVAGYVQRSPSGEGDTNAHPLELLDLGSGELLTIHRGLDAGEGASMAAAAGSLRKAMRDDADLVVIGRFFAFEAAAKTLMASIDQGISQGMPVLTSIAGHSVHKWQDFMGQGGTMIPPDMEALWRWWGAERIYHDLALGVPDGEVRQVVYGPRRVMVEGPHGTGVAYLPANSKAIQTLAPRYRRASLRELAGLAQSWDGVEMAVGLAAINAHYNRADLEGGAGSGAHLYRQETRRVVAIGVFPGLNDLLPNAKLVKHEPGPGEFPLEAMDILLPGCAAVVVTSPNIANRKLPRILRLAQGASVAVVGPETPLTPRLFSYGVDVLGGLVVRDPVGLAAAIRAGAQPRDFERFGHYLHIRREG